MVIFFSSATGVFLRDTSKALEQHLKEYLVFFTGDNLVTILFSVHIQLHQIVKPLLIDIES